ncbi:hypothetical protein BD410DRAFT_882954 [Rickenella mellea]|uniref:F-box domain-containing protein n=1 Tax=Rickenella mellea TaxID=50990 RepID=A0A4Y7PSX3_9AGAM|nr:hypothetical protein BD410DRAFT_882954 [Rickenella mellea]
MPRLQKLVLRMDAPVIQFGAFGSQSLREVIIHGVCDTLTLDVCWIFITQCPNLEVFQAHCYSYVPFTHHHAATLRHARLEYLHLDVVTADPGPFFDKFEAPDLKFMSLHYYNLLADGEQEWQHLKSFLNRSKCQLKHLAIGVARMSEGDIVNCLHATPGLKSLSLDRYPFMTKAAIISLKLNSQNSVEDNLCPKLETLCFHFGLRCSARALEDMVVSRCTNVTTTLRKVSLYGCHNAPYEELLDAPGIVRCIEEGLQLVEGVYWDWNVAWKWFRIANHEKIDKFTL